jgi:protease II
MSSVRAACLFLLGTAACPVLASAQLAPGPRQILLNETIHGIALSDEYRWMEDPTNEAEWAGWVAMESQRSRKLLGALPSQAEFADLIASRLRA